MFLLLLRSFPPNPSTPTPIPDLSAERSLPSTPIHFSIHSHHNLSLAPHPLPVTNRVSHNARLFSQSHPRLAAGPHPSPISDADLGDANPFFDALCPLRGRQAGHSEHRAQHATGHRIELGHSGTHCGRDACSSWTVALRPHGTQAFAGPHTQEELLRRGE